jgi:hypothetical protein
MPTSSATQTGLSLPSRSTTASLVSLAPCATSSTETMRNFARRRLPAGTGAVKRTLLAP